jgi:peptide/nickel transport system substrate-binding protein
MLLRHRNARRPRASRILAGLAIAAGVVVVFTTVMPRGASGGLRGAQHPADTIVSSIRAEPRSFNRYVARDLTTIVVTYLTQSTLVRVNRVTNQLEPELAESWERLSDNRTFRVRLRPGLRFSDGAPFSADDVVFSFRAIGDERTASVLADNIRVGSQPVAIWAEDAATVAIRFPFAFGPGLRLLDAVPILPRHLLKPRLDTGTFRSAWGPSTPPTEMAGLGPFVLRRYDPGQQLVFDRNPYHWRWTGERAAPRVKHVVLDVVPDQEAESLALEAGTIDFTQGEIRPSDFGGLKRAIDRGRVTLTDLGVGLDGDLFWINLTAAAAKDPRHRWLQHPDFRRVVSHSIDRQAFVDAVYMGAAVPAYGVISPGNREWYVDAPTPPYDLDAAKRLLASLKLTARDGDMLRDTDGTPVHFSLLTQKGNSSLERGAFVIRESLARVGVRVDVVALEVGTLMQYVAAGNYDAAYFRLLLTDTDPALNTDFWLSSGSAHVWSPSQRTPETSWESEIDRFMEGVVTTLDPERRRALFADVQRTMAREVPVLCFAYPRLSFAMSTRIVHATPAPFRPPVLWNPSAIDVRDGSTR